MSCDRRCFKDEDAKDEYDCTHCPGADSGPATASAGYVPPPHSVETVPASLVRRNLMEQQGYSPYCGAERCYFTWPRTSFDGEQFKCRCGWRSYFEPEFIAEYKAKRNK